MKSLSLILITLISFVALSCKESNTTPTLSKKELLAGTSTKSWKSTKADAANATGSKIDLVNSQQPCLVDNILILNVNGTFEIKEGATKCNAADPESVLKANWSLSSDEKYLIADKIVFAGFVFTNAQFEILELTETKFVGKSKLKIKINQIATEQEFDLTATFEAVK